MATAADVNRLRTEIQTIRQAIATAAQRIEQLQRNIVVARRQKVFREASPEAGLEYGHELMKGSGTAEAPSALETAASAFGGLPGMPGSLPPIAQRQPERVSETISPEAEQFAATMEQHRLLESLPPGYPFPDRRRIGQEYRDPTIQEPPKPVAELAGEPAASTRISLNDIRHRSVSGRTIEAQPEEDAALLDQLAEFIAPAPVTGPESVARNLGVDKVVGGIIGAFAGAIGSAADLISASAPGRIPNPLKLRKAAQSVLEHAAGFVAFPAQELTKAAVVAGLGPEGWNPHWEIIQRKLSGDPMTIDELEQKYPVFAKNAMELASFPAGPTMALSALRHQVARPTQLFKDIEAVNRGRMSLEVGPEVKEDVRVFDEQTRIESGGTRTPRKLQGHFTTEVVQANRQPISERSVSPTAEITSRPFEEATPPEVRAAVEAVRKAEPPRVVSPEAAAAADRINKAIDAGESGATIGGDLGEFTGTGYLVSVAEGPPIPKGGRVSGAIIQTLKDQFDPLLKKYNGSLGIFRFEDGTFSTDVNILFPRTVRGRQAAKILGRAMGNQAIGDMIKGKYQGDIKVGGSGKLQKLSVPDIIEKIRKVERSRGEFFRDQGTVEARRLTPAVEGEVTSLSPTDTRLRTGAADAGRTRIEGEGAPDRLNVYLGETPAEKIVASRSQLEFKSDIPRSELYDVVRDPLGLREKGMSFTELEKRVKAKGYLGIENSELGFAALFRKVPVKSVKEIGNKKAPLDQSKLPPHVRLTKEAQAAIRESIDSAPLPEHVRRGMQESFDEALAEGLHLDAVDRARQSNAAGTHLSKKERSGMGIRQAQILDEFTELENRRSTAAKAGDRQTVTALKKQQDVLKGDLDILTEALDRVASASGSDLQFTKALINRVDYSLGKIIQRAENAKAMRLRNRDLTDIERGNFKKLAEGVIATDKKLADALASESTRVEAIEEVIAKAILEATKVKAKLLGKKKSKVRRIEDVLAEQEKKLGELGLVARTGLDPKLAWELGKWTVNRIRLGVAHGEITSMKDVYRAVKEKFPELSKEEIHEALAAQDPARVKAARAAAEQMVQEFKTHGALLHKFDQAVRGIFDPKRKRKEAPREIRDLRRILTKMRRQAYRTFLDAEKHEKFQRAVDEAQDMLANRYRQIKRGKTPESVATRLMKDKLADLRAQMREADKLADFQEQLRTGDFKFPGKRPKRLESPELIRAKIASKEAKEMVDAAIHRLEPIGPKKIFQESASFLRTMRATADLSAIGRQGMILGVANRKALAKAVPKSVEAFFKRHVAEEIDIAIRAHQNYPLAVRAKLELTRVGSALSKREEAFASSLAERLVGWGAVVKASERNMTTFLNMMRMEHFNRFLELRPNATRAELAAMADWINIASGRGNFKMLPQAASVLSAVLFAPKFALSRIQVPIYGARALAGELGVPSKIPHRVRVEILKDLGKNAAFGASILAFAAAAGADVTLDPESPDFGKVRIGNTRIDIFAGVQQPMRVLLRGSLGLFNGYEDVDLLELIGRFTSYKLGPVVTLPYEAVRGETLVGEERTLIQTGLSAITPLVFEDIWDAIHTDNALNPIAVGGLVFGGVGVQTYVDSRTSTIRKIKALRRAGKEREATQLRDWWNLTGRKLKEGETGRRITNQSIEVDR